MVSQPSPILEMRGITKIFPGVKALEDVTMTVTRGEVHAICGENGAGKSTLMKVLSGVYPAGSYSGDIRFGGEVRRFKGIDDSEKLGIIIIHQELALVPLLSIAENIFLGNERARGGIIDWMEAYQQTRTLLAKVGLKEAPNSSDRPAHGAGAGRSAELVAAPEAHCAGDQGARGGALVRARGARLFGRVPHRPGAAG